MFTRKHSVAKMRYMFQRLYSHVISIQSFRSESLFEKFMFTIVEQQVMFTLDFEVGFISPKIISKTFHRTQRMYYLKGNKEM